MRMPFGKYRGYPLDQVPEDYLCWVLDHCTNASPTLREAIRVRLLGRASAASASASAASSTANGTTWVLAFDPLRLIKSWYRQMALRYHPDRGGNRDGMAAINFAYEELTRLFEEALSHEQRRS